MAPTNDRRVPEVATQILHYFERNPEAADSLEGIARWRLLEEQIHRSLLETQLALEWLVTQGFLVEVSSVSAGNLYRLNLDKAADIRTFLQQSGAGSFSTAKRER